MSRTKKSPVQPTPTEEIKQGRYWSHPDAEWGGFINVRLEEDAKPEVAKWLEENNDQVYPLMDDLMGEGMKIGLSWDRLNQCAIVTLTGSIHSNYMVRYVMTTRDSGWYDALVLSVWKHYVYLMGDWGNYLPRTSRSSVWG